MFGKWFCGKRVPGDPGARIGPLCAGLLSRGTFITVRVTPQGVLNAAHQRARLVRDAALAGLRADAGGAFSAFLAQLPSADATARLALGPEGVLVAVEPLRRALWASGPPLALALLPAPADLARYKSIGRQVLDAMHDSAIDAGLDGAALTARGEIVDGTTFHVLLRDGQGWFLAPEAREGATTALFCDLVPVATRTARWREVTAGLALSSLRGAVPIARLGGRSLDAAGAEDTALMLNDRLRETAFQS